MADRRSMAGVMTDILSRVTSLERRTLPPGMYGRQQLADDVADADEFIIPGMYRAEGLGWADGLLAVFESDGAVTQVFFPESGSPTTRTFYPGGAWSAWSLFVPAASDTTAGVVQRATNTEAIAGTNTTKFITPASLAAVVGSDTGLVDISSMFISPATGANVTARRIGHKVTITGYVTAPVASGVVTDLMTITDLRFRPSASAGNGGNSWGAAYISGVYPGIAVVRANGTVGFVHRAGATQTGNHQFTVNFDA